MPPPRRLSLQIVLVAAFVLVALVAIAFLSAQRYVWVTTDLLQEQLDHDLALARSVALSVDRYLAARRQLVETLAAEIAAVGLVDRGAVRSIVDTARRREPALSALLLLDAAGAVVAASPATDEEGRAHVGTRYGDRDWFREIGRGEVLRSYDVASRMGARPTLAVAAPIHASASPAGGVLVGVLSLEQLRRAVRDIDPGRRDRLVVADSQGRVVIHASRRWEDEAHDLSSEGVFLTAQRAAEGSIRYASQFTGTAKWGSYTRLPASGWVVWTTRDPGVGEEKLFPVVRALVLSGVVALALATAASVVVTRLLIRPLRTLTTATRAVGDRGHFRADFLAERDSRISEFSELLSGFRAMGERLRAQYGELEAKVAERTTALEAAARESQAAAAVLRTQDQIRRGYGELAALLNSLDRSHILNESTRKIAASLRAPTVAVYLVDEAGPGLHLKTYAALDPEMIDTTLLSPAGLPSQVARRGEPIVLDLAPGGERLRLMTGIGALEIGAVAGVPLRYQDSLLGVLTVALLEPFTEDTRSFLENAARQMSVALSNAGLFESLRFQSQQLERLNVELRQASELKSQFLASMSHELRTPLNSIIGFTELLLMSGREPLTDRQRSALDKVHGNAQHLLALINDVLDIARIQSGRMDVASEPFVLDTLVRECVATVEPQAQAKGLLLRVIGLEHAGTLVQDRGKVKQIVINLLSNAVTFTPVGSVEVRVSADPDAVSIAVADTGIGIPPEDHAIIFEEFRRSDGGDAGRPGGTGLGLAISRRLAYLMHGSLTVDSASGRGSVFTLCLPTRADGALRASSESYVACETRVLVIDDDANVADIVRETLASDAIEVESAPSAAEGLALARNREPAVILLDLVLHGHDDGWEVLQQLKADPATRDIPVVVHSMIDNADRARRLGADEVLVKPVAPAALRSLLRALVARPTVMAAAGDR